MTLSEELAKIKTIFIDTAPVIYYIEANPEFGQLSKEVFELLQSGKLTAYSSVITLTEVLPKPVEHGDVILAGKFADFLKHGNHLSMIEISESIAEAAGELRGRYPSLKTVDAIQISAAIEAGSEAFLTNDMKLKQITDIRILVLKDYI